MDEEIMSRNKRIEIIPQVMDSGQRRIILNVGGQRHETYLGTIKNFQDTRLYWVVENVTRAIDYNSDKIELFFDRHPGIFAQVLNYYRTGKLHCPNDVCGPLFEEELAYWGIDEKDMEPCCWTSYTQHREAEQNLKSFNPPPECDTEPEDEIGPEELSNSLYGRKLSWQSHWQHFQTRAWAILDEPRSSKAAKVFSIVSVLLIVLSVGSSCAQTLPQFRDQHGNQNSTVYADGGGGTSQIIFNLVEYFCGVWFTLELLLRVIFCPHRLMFFTKLSNWIDILSVLPFYLRFINNKLADSFLTIRLLRLYRFFRLLYGLQVLMHTLRASSYELGLLLLILLIPVVLFSSMMYYVENNLDKNTQFHSIPESFWWSLVTMTTVGYGDIVPKTWPGKIIGGACAVCGVLMVALPISIIGSNFNLYYAHAQARLKLPRKKTRIHFDAMATALSSRHTFRRRALRRRSPGSCVIDSMRNSAVSKNQSIYNKRESNDARSLSSSTRSESFGVKYSPKTPKRKLSKEKPERKFSRREKTIPTLEHLPEKDEFSDNHSSGIDTFMLGRQSLGLPQVSDRLPSWLAQTQRDRRLRSSSVPSRRPLKSGIPKKCQCNLCARCSLQREGNLSYQLPEQQENIGTENCKCGYAESSGDRKESETSQLSLVSNFTLFIRDEIDGALEDCVAVSSESIDAPTKVFAINGSAPVQVQVLSTNQFETPTVYDDYKANLSDSSTELNCTDSGSETYDFDTVTEQNHSRPANKAEKVSKNLGVARKQARKGTSLPDPSKIPLLVIDMPRVNKEPADKETSL